MDFIRGLGVSNPAQVREAFLQAMEEWEKGGMEAPRKEPVDNTSIKDLFFSQLKQVAMQLGSAGKEAMSQVGSIKKDFKEKVKFTEGAGGAPRNDGEDKS
jgi:hypothetical protein